VRRRLVEIDADRHHLRVVLEAVGARDDRPVPGMIGAGPDWGRRPTASATT